jgi:hypothetical protein
MKKSIASLAVLVLALVANPAPGDQHHINVALAPAPGSTVSGTVELTQLPHGGALINVNATGLQPGTVYASFYYESDNCTEPADLLKTFTAGDDGTGHAQGKIDDDLDEVGSVSVRLGPGYGTLQACAKVH